MWRDPDRRKWQGWAIGAATLLLTCGCEHETPATLGPILQRGYLWQRAWNPEVANAIHEADQQLDGVVVLGAEIGWSGGRPQPIEATISWPDLQALKKPCALAMRIAPYPGPFAPNDPTALALVHEAASLLKTARAHGVEPGEFEVDFDCAQDKLAGYELWLRALAQVVHPTRLVVTTLPAWLNEPDFPALVHLADGYVLQVHSVPTLAEAGHFSLCDPALVRKWVGQASRLSLPFSVALPTYWCLAGYSPSGKLIGVAMDSVQPAWPPGTGLLEFGPNADDLADLLKDWRANRPPGLREVLWYRLPVATDLHNWRWPTLLSVMQGRRPKHQLETAHGNGAPVDFSIANRGEAEENLACDVVVSWNGARVVACDALPGWTVVPGEGKAVFTPSNSNHPRLSPGTNLNIGWIRFQTTPALQTQLVSHE